MSGHTANYTEACQVGLGRRVRSDWGGVSGRIGEACQVGLGRRVRSDRGSVSGQTVEECIPASKGLSLHPPPTHISLEDT